MGDTLISASVNKLLRIIGPCSFELRVASEFAERVIGVFRPFSKEREPVEPSRSTVAYNNGILLTKDTETAL